MPLPLPDARRHPARLALLLTVALFPGGCLCHLPGSPEKRKGDEVVVAGQFFHTGTPVVLWMDPGGYDAYRVQRRFAPYGEADYESSRPSLGAPGTPNRYDARDQNLAPQEIERVRGGGWDLPTLQSNIDQLVLHFDATGTSRACFKALQDTRDLSVHFLCDLDGTIYQTLDVKERARHATLSNNRSVGIEIANMGAYGEKEKDPFAEWYKKEPDGRTVIAIPARYGPEPERTPHFAGRPARRDAVAGEVQGQPLRQYDFTPQQYRALARLTAALCAILPQINCDYPREAGGKLMTHTLPAGEWKDYKGVLGHYHIQANKVDPGPALQWDYLIGEARRLMKQKPQRTVEGKAAAFRPKLIVDN